VCMSPGKAACMSGLSACWPANGICALPCDYSTVAPAKKMSKRMSKKKM
jgi:hypothetical protein